MPLNVLATARLTLRRLTLDDAAFILELVNDPAWLRYIGDRGVRDLASARAYLQRAPLASYEKFGFGMYLVALKADGSATGICGLIQRDTLPDVDIGFAFLRRYWGQGYAVESATAALAEGKEKFGLRRVVAITSPDNDASIRVLAKLGFGFEKMIRVTEDAAETKLFARAL